MQGEDSILASSPSFSSYSSTNFAETAAKVIHEFQDQRQELGLEGEETDEILLEKEVKLQDVDDHHEDDDVDDDDFEFTLLCRDPNVSPISADEIFANGQIKPVYPVFNRDLLFTGGEDDFNKLQNGETIRLSLRKLMIQERDPSSSSSSETDELEGLPDGTYCVWTPKPPQASPDTCKKSNSTGSSSKRWRFRDLLHRSHSDGKETYVYLTPSAKHKKEEEKKHDDKLEAATKEKIHKDAGKVKLKAKSGEGASSVSAHEVHYVRNRAIKEGDRRRSYLPYRQDLVGLFANVNGLNRTLRPF